MKTRHLLFAMVCLHVIGFSAWLRRPEPKVTDPLERYELALPDEHLFDPE